MLIGLCGGICAGKDSIANFLVETYGFKKIALNQDIQHAALSDTVATSASNGQHSGNTHVAQGFDSLDLLLEFVTKRWLRNCVITDIKDEPMLEALSRRPFFFLVVVDAPIITRWQRCKQRSQQRQQEPPSLEQFIQWNDEMLNKRSSNMAKIMYRAEMRIMNNSQSLDAFYRGLEGLKLVDDERLRPSWDQYFMRLASLAAQRSNCMKRRVGCVLVREKRVISTGYNGTPRHLRNCNQGGCTRCNGALKSGVSLSACLCLHAEENALLEAGRERIREGAILYCDTCPCLTCSVKIAQVGISEVVYSQSYSMDKGTAAIFAQAGIRFRQFAAPPSGLVFLEDV